MIFENYHLDRSIPIPLYYQLKGFILSDIQNGTYPIGSCIPTELEIQKRFQISRTTIRQAITELVQEGWLERQTSKGTYVTSPPNSPDYIKDFEPFYQQISKTGKTPSTELLNLNISEATAEIAAYLDISPGEKVIFLSRKRFADNIPIVTSTIYLPYSLCYFILGQNLEKESLHELLSQHPDTKITHVRNIITAETATSEDAQLLQTTLNAPILCFHTTCRTSSGVVCSYTCSRYLGTLSQYQVDVCPDFS